MRALVKIICYGTLCLVPTALASVCLVLLGWGGILIAAGMIYGVFGMVSRSARG